MMLEDALRKGFALAHQRLGFVFIDILWKIVWAVATAAGLLLIAAWFGSDLRGLAWQDTGASTVNAWIAATILREFWTSNRAEIYGAFSAVLLLSAFAWLFLEAYFRSRIVMRPNTKVFLASGATKAAVLGMAGIILISVGMAGATTDAIVMFAALAFFVTVLDTLVRADAVELLGTDLIRVSGLIGILLLFEAMILAAFAVIVIAGFLNVSRLSDAILMLGVTAVSIVVLNVFHSYLLLVRFSAVGIMRHDVVRV
jgi:hypothetical protein